MAERKKLFDLIVARHPHSQANEDDANYGNVTVLSEKGKRQLAGLKQFILDEDIDHIVTSSAQRTLGTVLDMGLGIPLSSSSIFNERRRPPETVGTKNSHPETRRILDEALAHYGNEGSLHGEETYEETLVAIEMGLGYILDLATRGSAKRIFLLTHGLRARMYFLHAALGVLRPEDYREAYYNTGFENAGVMRMSYGERFGLPGSMGWRVELADNSHVPKEAR